MCTSSWAHKHWWGWDGCVHRPAGDVHFIMGTQTLVGVGCLCTQACWGDVYIITDKQMLVGAGCLFTQAWWGDVYFIMGTQTLVGAEYWREFVI